jgi:uncharacterized protein
MVMRVVLLAGAALLLQLPIPPPRGYVNDFAGVLDSASIARMDAVIREVRARTRGEIAVVTLPDIGDRAPADVAVRIGRAWGVGARGAAGDPAKNLGVVILLVPLKDHRPGTGRVFIATGRGAEGFLPDARVGRIRDAMLPYLAREEYGPGLARGVDLVAQAFAQEFGVPLAGAPPAPPASPAPVDSAPGMPAALLVVWFAVVVLMLALAARRRVLFLPLFFGGSGGGRGWGGGWGRGGGGGFSGGFGGFGGGGGFSGGGAGGRF